MAVHTCAACRSVLFGCDFVEHGAGEMDRALLFHTRGLCQAPLEREVLAALPDAGPSASGRGVGSELRPDGVAPLLFLARAGNEEGALRALSRCVPADVRARDRFGVCALHHASHHGHTTLVRALLAARADAGARTADSVHAHVGGRTALHLAAANAPGRAAAEIVSALLAAGADASAEDADGATAAELAARRGAGAAGSALAQLLGGVPDDERLALPAAVAPALERACARDRQLARLDVSSRPLLSRVHVLPAVWDGAQCARVRECALEVARARGWQSARHAHHPTVDVPLWRAPAAHAIATCTLNEVVLPRMAELFGLDARSLRAREAFVVLYSADGAGSRAGLELHRDGTLLSANVLLNERDDGGGDGDGGDARGVGSGMIDGFEGGGTYFADDDRTVKARPGDFVLHCGQLLHGAAPVLRGRRLVLVFFIDELDEHESPW
ncbi:hypothetical protein KFE25_009654 [Diacronema lutheri]|uniref:Fe2OG dioxygenase domain-containing protein n=1 Tax=Diacronema lutheri TaxID=2081491 RepID=A0A8J6CKL6_DIALT|nr:hypothetical protein KFE25_009654 [Diacronema lutheri]